MELIGNSYCLKVQDSFHHHIFHSFDREYCLKPDLISNNSMAQSCVSSILGRGWLSARNIFLSMGSIWLCGRCGVELEGPLS